MSGSECGPFMGVHCAWEGGGREKIPGPGWERGFRASSPAVQLPACSCVSSSLLQDCLGASPGICYDGLEALLYLGLFSSWLPWLTAS